MNMSISGVTGVIEATQGIQNAVSMAGKNGYRVGTEVDYSIHQEYGTSRHPAQPHMRPAIDDTRRQLGRIAANADDLDDYLFKAAVYLEGETKRRAPVDTGRLRASYGPPIPF